MRKKNAFSASIQLSHSTYLVVEESSDEPKSIGSYSIRLYNLTNPDFPTDNFVSGIVRGRDGTIQSIEKADINKDGEEDLVVLIRSAGSGGYLQAEAFQCIGGGVEVIASVLDLDPKAKYLEELRSLAD
ncbi:PliI family lysozyme inhibitor of I-type lysozyme [Opitutaceae bacterium]|nr:PliI family lysozyme inhibitor of I-type lysozyme [Opitutaceae bacterium]